MKISPQSSRVALIISNLNECNPSNCIISITVEVSNSECMFSGKVVGSQTFPERSFVSVVVFSFCPSKLKLVRHFQHQRKAIAPSGKFSTEVITFVSCPYALYALNVNMSTYA